MKIIIINDNTISCLAEQLSNKYPYLKTQEKNFKLIFHYWIKDNEIIGEVRLINSINFLVDSVVKLQKYDNIEQILKNISHTKNRSPIINKYQIYHKHKLSDFPFIHFAADFYGKSIAELAADAMQMYDSNSSSIKKIKSQKLRDQIKHLIECDILILLGILFFHLKIATITEDIFQAHQELFCREIMAQILKNKAAFDYDKIANGCLAEQIRELDKKTGTGIEYYDGFACDRIKSIYDMFYEPVKHIKSLSKVDLEKYLNQFPESSIITSTTLYSPITKNNSFFLDKYFYLMVIYHQFGNIKEHLTGTDTKYNIKPTLFSFSNNKLVIEI